MNHYERNHLGPYLHILVDIVIPTILRLSFFPNFYNLPPVKILDGAPNFSHTNPVWNFASLPITLDFYGFMFLWLLTLSL